MVIRGASREVNEKTLGKIYILLYAVSGVLRCKPLE